MYSSAFCKIYNEFGWNAYPEVFADRLLQWLQEAQITAKTCMDLACGTGILCRLLQENGIQTSGMDFSRGMIDIARRENPGQRFTVADMVTFRPQERFDLVTCTGDSLNHIMAPEDVAQIFRNVYGYLNEGGWFVFDILREDEATDGEMFELDFGPTTHAQFQIRREGDLIRLHTRVFENGQMQVDEVITEKVHDMQEICRLLREAGFRQVTLADRLPQSAQRPSTTWYVMAKK